MHLSTRSSARLGDIPNAAPRSGLAATETAKPGLILRSDSQRNVSREWMPPPLPRAGFAVGGTSLLRNPLPWRGSLDDFQGEVVWNWGPTEGTGGGPSPYEPRPAYQFLVNNIVGSSRGTPDVAAVADPFTGCGSTTRAFLVGSSLVEPAFHPGMGGHRQRGGSGRQLHAVEVAQIYASASWSDEASRGSRTSPPVRAVSDPTSRASWPLKAGTSAPGWAARSVTLAS
jgi:hypothetical protein